MENAVFSPTSIQLRIANITKKHAENHEIHCKNEKKKKYIHLSAWRGSKAK